MGALRLQLNPPLHFPVLQGLPYSHGNGQSQVPPTRFRPWLVASLQCLLSFTKQKGPLPTPGGRERVPVGRTAHTPLLLPRRTLLSSHIHFPN